ncbi:hypothetical protein BC828DRAFT_408443 [Blastocladiella britannica]|nr:hypothetical protein BC828DRAFT_408443 [Blastocladiella britannica]
METGSQDLSDLGRAGGQLRVIAFSGVTGRVYVTAAANASSIMTYTVSLSVLVGRTNGAPHSAVELRPPAAQPVLSLTQRLDGDSDDRRRINSTTSHAVNQGSWTLWPLGADAQAIAALNASQIPVVSVQLTVPALALMARNISLLIDAPDMDVVLDGDASHVYHSLSVATRETVRAYGGTVYSTSGSTMSPPLFVRRSLDVQILPPTEANNSTSSSPYLSPLVELPKVAFVDAGASANITVAAVGALDVGMVPPMDGRSSFDAYLSGPMVRLRLPTDANLRWTATMDDRRLVMPAAVNYTIPPPTGINGSLAEGFVGAVPEDSRSNGTRVVTVEGKGTFSLSWMKD